MFRWRPSTTSWNPGMKMRGFVSREPALPGGAGGSRKRAYEKARVAGLFGLGSCAGVSGRLKNQRAGLDCELVTHGFSVRTPDVENACSCSTCGFAGVCSAFCSAVKEQKASDLAVIIESWSALPEPVRAGIMAFVRAAKNTSQNS